VVTVTQTTKEKDDSKPKKTPQTKKRSFFRQKRNPSKIGNAKNWLLPTSTCTLAEQA
jgi:hypothetical protein